MSEKVEQLRELQKYEKLLTRQEYMTLREQILDGNSESAMLGLKRVIDIMAFMSTKEGTEYAKVRADYEGY